MTGDDAADATVLDYGDDLLRANPNHTGAGSGGEEDSEVELDDVESLVAGMENTKIVDPTL